MINARFELLGRLQRQYHQHHQQLGQLLGQPNDIVDHRVALNSLRPKPAGTQPGFAGTAPINQCPSLANRDGQG